MAKRRTDYTPDSQIISALRGLFLRSRERRAALKRDDSTCWTCKAKASRAKGREQKVEVHHIEPVKFKRIVKVIREELLCSPNGLMTVCPDCHKAEHRPKTCVEPFSGE